MDEGELFALQSLITEKINAVLIEKEVKFDFLSGVKVIDSQDGVIIEIPKTLYDYNGKRSKKYISKGKIKSIIYSSLYEWKNYVNYDTINIR